MKNTRLSKITAKRETSIWTLLENHETEEHEDNGDTYCNWRSWNGPQRFGKEAGRIGNRRMNRDHPNYSIIKIDYETEKSRRDLGRLAVR